MDLVIPDMALSSWRSGRFVALRRFGGRRFSLVNKDRSRVSASWSSVATALRPNPKSDALVKTCGSGCHAPLLITAGFVAPFDEHAVLEPRGRADQGGQVRRIPRAPPRPTPKPL